MIYLDTSWLVKLYVQDTDSTAVRGLVGGDATVLVSDVSYVEFHSAVARRQRDGALSTRAAGDLVKRFRQEWTDWARIAVSRDVVARAADLVANHPLRSLDALHLASALVVATRAPERLRFGTADTRLVTAAHAEGLDTLAVV